MPLKTAYIALGSNLGDRIGQMRDAIDQLEADRNVCIQAVSPVYQNPAVGLGDAPDFLNAVARIRTDLSPRDLLDLCLSIESQLGRVRSGQPASRRIDLDLLLYQDVRLDTPHLRLPHPRIAEREFVARPLFDLDNDLTVSGKPIRTILAAIHPQQLTLWPEALR